MSWQDIISNIEIGKESRFSIQWYRNHPITIQMLKSEIQWGKTIEIASGLGIRALLLHENKNCQITGIDIDEFAVAYANKIAQERFGYGPPNVLFTKGSFYDVPFPDNYFDNAVLVAGIEHAFYPVQVLDEIERVVRPGGTLFFSVTNNNYHADPDHKSSWNESSVRRLLSSYGDVTTWVYENIIFAVLRFHKRFDVPDIVLCDLDIQDSYFLNWVEAFQKLSKVKLVSIRGRDVSFANSNIIRQLCNASKDAQMLFFGTGPSFENMQEVCKSVKQVNPCILISKWFSDATNTSLFLDRYVHDVYEPSKFFDQAFVVDTNRIGQIAPSCGQFHLNGMYSPSGNGLNLNWKERPIDILCIANAYSDERLKRIKSFLPKEKFSYLWVGDGSFHGRVPRQFANRLYSLSKIVLNIVDTRYRSTRHWVSNRVYWASGNGCLVFSSPVDGVNDLFDGGIVVLDDNPLSWQDAYNYWLSDNVSEVVLEMLRRNQIQVSKYHAFEYKAYSILRHSGFAVARVSESYQNESQEQNPAELKFGFNFFRNECILAEPVSSLSAQVKLELGCGTTKSLGFIGTDRFRLPGVDVQIDLNRPLPFASNSVDLLYASHSLEHVDDLMFVMSEIYRVCKHRAQVCIVAPYYQQTLNFANPYHKQVFNEHTPRFWTNSNSVPIDKSEFDHPASYLWGLAQSDNSLAQIDIRLIRMEFFYFPEYRHLPAEERRQARKKNFDVCDQIMYNLIVIKEPVDDDNMKEIIETTSFYEPPYVTIRRLTEQMQETQNKLEESEKKSNQNLQ
ncbi:MAG: class I SAM-dependent methyltransferase, partial [Bacteroidia bacterium]|nr:class I SAM-dependent methyltransferase [Bacteroidia bacterium]